MVSMIRSSRSCQGRSGQASKCPFPALINLARYYNGLSELTGAVRAFFFLMDRRSRIYERMVIPAIAPTRRESAITTARDASKCQTKKDTATGPAFWTEKRTTTNNAMTVTISEITFPPRKDHLPTNGLGPCEAEGRRKQYLMTPVVLRKNRLKAFYFVFLVLVERVSFSRLAICASSFFICATMFFAWGSSAGFFTREPMSA